MMGRDSLPFRLVVPRRKQIGQPLPISGCRCCLYWPGLFALNLNILRCRHTLSRLEPQLLFFAAASAAAFALATFIA